MISSAFWRHFLNMCLVTSSFIHYYFILSTEMNPSKWYHTITGKLISYLLGLLRASLRSPVVHGLCFWGHFCLYMQNPSGPESSWGSEAEVGRHHSLSLKLPRAKKVWNYLVTSFYLSSDLFIHLVHVLYKLQRWTHQWNFKPIL